MLDFTLNLLLKLAGAGKKTVVETPHLQTGIDGEDAAARFIRKQGYNILASRWATKQTRGDLDLVAMKDNTLCFIEVKTRTAHDSSPAERTVNAHKRRTLRKMARSYLSQFGASHQPPVRFDILCVYLIPGKAAEFEHFEGAFQMRDHKKFYER